MAPLFLSVQFEFTSAIGPHVGRYVVEPALLRAHETRSRRAAAAGAPVTGAGAGQATAAPSAAAAATVSESETPRDPDAYGRRPGSSESLDPYLDMRNHQLAGTTRGVGASDVLVITVASAPPVRLRILRKARDTNPDGTPDAVPLLFAAYVKGSEPFDQKGPAEAALQRVRQSDELQRQWVREGLTVVNAAIRAYRAGAPDPYAMEVLRRDARKIRIGYGDTDDIQAGHFREVVELPPGQASRISRIERLKPEEAVAGVLSRRGVVLEGEDLLLRAFVDLDNHRTRAATFQVAAALRLIPSELKALPGGDKFDFRDMEHALQRSELLVRAVSERPLEPAEVAELEKMIDQVATLIDTWRYHQIEG